MAVYLRKYELVIGEPIKTYEVAANIRNVDISAIITPFSQEHSAYTETNGHPVQTQKYIDYRTVPDYGQALIIDSLHIEADIEYSSEPEDIKGSSAKIAIYNLKPSSREAIKKDGMVFLKGGYERDTSFVGTDQEDDVRPTRAKLSTTPLIFCGQIESVYTMRRGQDIITELVCKDLGFPGKNVAVSKSYPRGTSYDTIIEDLLSLAAQNGMPTGFFLKPANRTSAPLANPLSIGYNVEGNLLDVLGRVAKESGLQAYVAGGQVFVEPRGDVTRIEVVQLTPSSIKSIEKEDNASGDTYESEETISGVRVTTFLNGNLAVNKMLRITEGFFQGSYKITNVKHDMSLEGGAWDTILTATKLGQA